MGRQAGVQLENAMTIRSVSRTALMVLAAASAVASTAHGAPAPGKASRSHGTRACFRAADVRSWAPQGRETVNLRTGVRDYYQLKLLGPCPDIDWNLGIGLESRGSSWICSGLDATVISRTPVGPQRCPATEVRKLTAEEVAALPPRARP